MKTVILGDSHGRDLWKQIVEIENDADRIIFLGDYFDSFDIPGVVQLQNFLDIVEFKKNSDKEVVLLFGNHDYHYMPGFTGYGYSGYQAALAYQFRDAIEQNLEHFQMAYLFNDVLCSHAGISPEWLEMVFGKPNDESGHNWNIDTMDGIKHVVELINDHLKFKPSIFEFNGFNGYGDDTWQTPIWIRPNSLMKSNKKNPKLKKNIIQVVGHTQVKDIFASVLASEAAMGNRYFLNDAIETRGYLIHESGEFIPKEVNND
jgi:hypothetical protein